jgi:RHS repeat-associated protein
LSVSSTEITDAATSLSVYFAGKRVAIAAAGVTTPFVQDRLGSNMSWAINRVSLYPWGEDRGTPAPNDQIKFATYTRDSATQLDYADQRYYSNIGRFMSPDPAGANAANPRKPASWNRYAYAGGDPVNRNDPTGLSSCALDDPLCNPFAVDPDDDDDDDGGETINYPCYAPNGFEPMPGPGCQGGGPPQPTPQPPVADCTIELFQRPTPSGGPAKGWGQHTYIYVSDSDYPGVAFTNIPPGLMIEGGPQNGKLTGFINPPGQGLAAGKWNASNPFSSTNQEVGGELTGPQACGDIISLLNAVNNYNSGPKVPYAFLGTTNSNAFTYTLLSDIGLSAFFGHPSGFTPGWGQTITGLTVP